ncbi:MAG: hypothetical protein WCA21_00105, partial [Terracidiphilus sp.]
MLSTPTQASKAGNQATREPGYACYRNQTQLYPLRARSSGAAGLHRLVGGRFDWRSGAGMGGL